MDSFSISNSPFLIVRHRLVGEGVVQLECPKNRRGVAGPDMIFYIITARSGCPVFSKIPGSLGRGGFGTFGDWSKGGGDSVSTV